MSKTEQLTILMEELRELVLNKAPATELLAAYRAYIDFQKHL